MKTEKTSDCWQTPDWLFEELDKEFNFDIDLCATAENSKCDKYMTDYLNNTYNHVKNPFHESGQVVWNERDNLKKANYPGYSYSKKDLTAFMNPPYSNPKPFIEKAWEDSKHCKIVCLVKCDPSTQWWATFWNYTKGCERCSGSERTKLYCKNCEIGSKPGCEMRFFPKRIKFDPPQQLVDTGEVWKVGNKWVRKCNKCDLGSVVINIEGFPLNTACLDCKGKGYKELSDLTFPCALVIMDRRNVT